MITKGRTGSWVSKSCYKKAYKKLKSADILKYLKIKYVDKDIKKLKIDA